MGLFFKQIPAITAPSGGNTGWIDVSAMTDVSIQVVQATGAGISWAVDVSNDGTASVAYATGLGGDDILGAGGLVRNSATNANPFPAGTHYVRIAATGADATVTICGVVVRT